MHNQIKVLLPKWVFEPTSKKEQNTLIMQYMQRYPHYAVIAIENGFAVCERL